MESQLEQLVAVLSFEIGCCLLDVELLSGQFFKEMNVRFLFALL